MRKFSSILLFLVIANLSYATYPVVDVRNIAESVKLLQEASRQTGILSEQTNLMIQELNVLWSTYDNAIKMYDTLGKATNVLGRTRTARAWRNVNRDFSRIGKALEGGIDARDIGTISSSARRIFNTTRGAGDRATRDIDTLRNRVNLPANNPNHIDIRRNYLTSLVRRPAEDMAAMTPQEVEEARDRMTEDERSQAMIENSWVAQAESLIEVEQVRQFNKKLREKNQATANETPEDILSAVEKTRQAVLANTEIAAENMDLQSSLLLEQNRLLLEGNELLNMLNTERGDMVRSILSSGVTSSF